MLAGLVGCSGPSTPAAREATVGVPAVAPAVAPPDAAVIVAPDAAIIVAPDAAVVAIPTTASALPDLPYPQLDKDERGLYMKDLITPRFAALFRGYDATKYVLFSCMTCHRTDGSWEMPNPALPKLSPAAMKAARPAALAFMRKQITPVMAKLVGKEVSTDDDPSSFGCASCHVVEDAPAGWKPR
jgi:cytochrome c553